MSMAWEPDRRSNFFFSPHAHLCAVTYIAERSLIVTLSNQFTSHHLEVWLFGCVSVEDLTLENAKGHINVFAGNRSVFLKKKHWYEDPGQ